MIYKGIPLLAIFALKKKMRMDTGSAIYDFLRAQLRFKPTKTDNSHRTVPLPVQAVELLQRHKREQDTYKRLHADRYADSDLVFPWNKGRAWNPRRFSSRFNRKIKQLELPTTSFHGLRTATPVSCFGSRHGAKDRHLLGHSSVKSRATPINTSWAA